MVRGSGRSSLQTVRETAGASRPELAVAVQAMSEQEVLRGCFVPLLSSPGDARPERPGS
jgi:hypothetical protein